MGRNQVSLLLAVILLSAKALGYPAGNSTNGTEIDDAFLEDALEKWLGNFDTYMFMMEQDVDDVDSDGGDEELVSEESLAFEEEEDEEEGDEDYDEGSSSPITMTIRRPGGLLDPNIDYKVTLESLVAEGGSVLVTLGNFGNMTACGVGGFSPPAAKGRGIPEGRLNISHQHDGDRSTTIVAFAVDTEEEESTTTWTVGDEGSEWEEHSQNLWWAMGRLAGGGLLTLTFTPPECGCLTLKSHYALPVGENLTLVVGPEAYPEDLEKLLCVDPLSRSIEENLIEQDIDDGSAIHDALGDSDPLQEKGDDTDPSDASGEIVTGRGRWAARKKAKLQRKKMRQEARQAIRQAGRRVTRQRVRKHMRLRRRDDEAEEETETRQVGLQSGGHGGRWARKQARKAARKQTKRGRKAWKGKKPWKKHRKHARKHGHRTKHSRRNRHHRNHNITGDATPGPEEAYEDLLPESDDHLNTTEPLTDEDTLADILLGEEEGEEEDEPEPTPADVGPVSRRGRKHRRQRGRARKLRNKEKKKGARFCCKHGIKFKKSQLLLKSDVHEADQPEITCNNTNDIISTYALHQFSIGSTQCSSRYETCCSKFTLQLWENLKAKKAARKAKRKQQRKATRQQKRRQSRRQRGYSTTPMTSTTQ